MDARAGGFVVGGGEKVCDCEWPPPPQCFADGEAPELGERGDPVGVEGELEVRGLELTLYLREEVGWDVHGWFRGGLVAVPS